MRENRKPLVDGVEIHISHASCIPLQCVSTRPPASRLLAESSRMSCLPVNAYTVSSLRKNGPSTGPQEAFSRNKQIYIFIYTLNADAIISASSSSVFDTNPNSTTTLECVLMNAWMNPQPEIWLVEWENGQIMWLIKYEPTIFLTLHLTSSRDCEKWRVAKSSGTWWSWSFDAAQS